jgi:hypothetical protein
MGALASMAAPLSTTALSGTVLSLGGVLVSGTSLSLGGAVTSIPPSAGITVTSGAPVSGTAMSVITTSLGGVASGTTTSGGPAFGSSDITQLRAQATSDALNAVAPMGICRPHAGLAPRFSRK